MTPGPAWSVPISRRGIIAYSSLITVQPKIFEGEKFPGVMSGPENFILEHFGPSKIPLKLIFSLRLNLTAPLVPD